MDYVTLGRTGLRVSVMGLGCGGPSRLGQTAGHSEAESIAVVQRALDLGVTLIDTAYAYGTETIVGKALSGARRGDVVLSTKRGAAQDGRLLSAPEMVAAVESSLQKLQTDYIDIFHLHGLKLEQYEHAANEIVPALLQLKDQGKIRFLGVTESFETDTNHAMTQRALDDDWWDVMMIGFNIINQSARQRVFPRTIAKGIGVLGMFAVRRALSRPDRLRAVMENLVERGQVDAAAFTEADPLDFVLADSDAVDLTDAAYRYCRHEPGMHVVLSGTGNVAHLAENAESLLRPALPSVVQQRLATLFAQVNSVSGS